MTASDKEGLALDIAVAALAKVQRLAYRQLSPAEWVAGREPDDLCTVAEVEDVITKALASVGHLETAALYGEDERPSLAHLPTRSRERVVRRLWGGR